MNQPLVTSCDTFPSFISSVFMLNRDIILIVPLHLVGTAQHPKREGKLTP